MSNIESEQSKIEESTQSSSQSAPKQWKSLDEWKNSLEFQATVENEFMSSPLNEDGHVSSEGAAPRRDFLKLMGASIALSSAGCLRRPAQKIIPYVDRPKDMIVGVANYYTSTFLDGGDIGGVIIKTREGRPIKVEGNPRHPMNQGGTTARAQAHVLSLYDPDRLRAPKKNLHNERRSNRDTIATDWKKVDKEVMSSLKKGKVAVLTSTMASPSTSNLLKEFLGKYNGKHYTWDAVAADSVLTGQEQSYGAKVQPRFRMDKADLIVSIGSDFLGTYLSPVEFTKQFSSRRDPNGKMNKLVVFESMLSTTGSNADERHRIKPSQQLAVAMSLLHELIVVQGHSKYSSDKSVKEMITAFKGEFAHLPQEKVSELAKELWSSKGKGLVVAGGINTQTKQAVELQVAVNFLNSILENDGATIDYKNSPFMTGSSSQSSVSNLLFDINAGKVNTLIVYGANPAYSLPKSSGFAAALNKVKLVVHAGEMTETALISDLMLPADHSMESWSDVELQKGVFSIQQPTIRPLYDSRSFQDMLLKWSGESKSWHEYIRQYWKKNILISGNFEDKWDEALQKGVVAKGGSSDFSFRNKSLSARNFKTGALKNIKPTSSPSGHELVLYQKIGIGDGTFANLSWLQELPDPVTKVVWDNYLNISPATAKKMSLKEGDVVRLKLQDDFPVLEVPTHIQPGVHDDVFALAVGYGRTSAGQVGNGVGVNAFDLVEFANGQMIFSGRTATIEKTGKSYELANTQGHHTMLGRPIAAQATYDAYKKNPSAGHFKHHFHGNIWDDHKYKGHKWGMVIDTNSCTGCSACVVACQSENNIPSVGKKYVLQGREMHWIRIDRYYSENPAEPETLHQPMVCQHCDNAPCETVCPVVATSHSSEGLNEMTYNRCVGTRYCANNCPYKVRRFNWFNFTKYTQPQEKVLNPEVMVRSRGVMEKCSFCVHKIKEAKNIAKDEKRELRDGDVTTACQTSCPADAITFGDLNDPKSKVAQLTNAKRSYAVLEELNTKPAVKYMTKIRHREATVAEAAASKGANNGSHSAEGGHH